MARRGKEIFPALEDGPLIGKGQLRALGAKMDLWPSGPQFVTAMEGHV